MPETKAHHIQTTRTGRYHTLGNLDEKTTDIWIVLHGYGQLAEYFIRNFLPVHHPGNYFIAPEALSRYYLNETTGRVGASWMTKDDRDNEIGDYLAYLDNLALAQNIPASCKLHVLGFSQGAATACRWVMHTSLPVTSLICWAGFFPKDMQWSSPRYLDPGMRTFLLYGDKDEYLNDELKNELSKLVLRLPRKPDIITFEGRHEIHAPTLLTLSKTIEK